MCTYLIAFPVMNKANFQLSVDTISLVVSHLSGNDPTPYACLFDNEQRSLALTFDDVRT